jgi:serine/threonine protein kinase
MILCDANPFEAAHSLCPQYRTITGGLLQEMLTKFGVNLSPEVVDLMQKIFNKEPSARPTIKELRAHPWMVNTTNAP